MHANALAASRVREGRYRDTALDERVKTPEIREVNVGFNRMAERLAKVEQERRLMLAGISHDLRTPLARLRLETELSVPDTQAQEAMVADIAQLDEIIDKFLDYARPDHTDMSPVLLAGVVSRCITPFKSQSRMKIEVNLPEDLQVQADAVELGRVISNLLENARRYGQSPGDGITHVRIEARAARSPTTARSTSTRRRWRSRVPTSAPRPAPSCVPARSSWPRGRSARVSPSSATTAPKGLNL